MIRMTIKSRSGELLSINEFEGKTLEETQVFRFVSGTCTRLFSRELRAALEMKAIVTIEEQGII